MEKVWAEPDRWRDFEKSQEDVEQQEQAGNVDVEGLLEILFCWRC